MARTCSICARDDVEIINRDLFAGVPFEQLHEKYGASVGALGNIIYGVEDHDFALLCLGLLL